MHGMAKFTASAYAVSGPVEYLDEVGTNGRTYFLEKRLIRCLPKCTDPTACSGGDGTHCSRASVGLRGQVEELYFQSELESLFL